MKILSKIVTKIMESERELASRLNELQKELGRHEL